MTIPSWITNTGLLGTITEGLYFEFQLNASGSNIKYNLQAGNLPRGLRLTDDGLIKGTPYTVESVIASEFVVRAYDSLNTSDLYDRTFTLKVNPVNIPFFITTDYLIVNTYCGVPINYSIKFSDTHATQPLTLSIISGSLPPGLTLNNSGNISGIVPLLQDYTGILASAYDQDPFDIKFFDQDPINPGYLYSDFVFTLKIDNGSSYDIRTYSIRIIEPPTTLEPVILTETGSIGLYRHDNYFEFRFEGYDVFDQGINWSIVQPTSIGYDIWYDNDVINFPNGHNPANDGLEGSYDNGYYDSSAYSSLPFQIDIDSGVLYGLIPSIVQDQITYNFIVRATKPINGVYSQKAFSITFVGDNDKQLTWITPFNMGTLTEGDLSYLQIETTNPSNLTIAYEYVSGNLPEGLTVLNSGAISGRAKFVGFNLDNRTTLFDNNTTTFDQKNEFTVRAYSVNNYSSETTTTIIYSKKFFTGDGFTDTFNIGAAITTQNLLVYVNGIGLEAQDLKFRNKVDYVTVTSGGSGYNQSTCYVTFSQPQLPGGSVAKGYAQIVSGSVDTIVITDNGSGYTSPPTVHVLDPASISLVPAVLVAYLGNDIEGDYQVLVDSIKFFNVPNLNDDIVVGIPTITTSTQTTYLIDETKKFSINIRNPYIKDYANIYIEALPKRSQRQDWYNLLSDTNLFPTNSLYYPDDPNYALPKKPQFLFIAGISTGYVGDFLQAMKHNFYKKQVIIGEPLYTTAYDPYTKIPLYETIYLPIFDNLENNKTVSVSRNVNIQFGKDLTVDSTRYTIDEIDINSSWTNYNIVWPNSYENMQANIREAFSYVTPTTFSGFPLWMKPLYPNLLNGKDPRAVYKRAIPIAYVKVGESKKILSNLKVKKIDFKRFTFEINRITADNNLGTTFDDNTTTISIQEHTEFDNHKQPLVNSISLYGTPYVLDPISELRDNLTTFDGKGTRFIDEDISFDENLNHHIYLRFNNNNVLE